ncbi:hypothetical protein BDZ97DRAFT_625312 [Flammula alnicola]|nr:hypothetical protein BDZ97DRAFT_625312 [Flammula alnicola]
MDVGNGWDYPRAMLAFLNSRPDGTNFYERNLVAVGHSSGGSTVVLLHEVAAHPLFFVHPARSSHRPT